MSRNLMDISSRKNKEAYHRAFKSIYDEYKESLPIVNLYQMFEYKFHVKYVNSSNILFENKTAYMMFKLEWF